MRVSASAYRAYASGNSYALSPRQAALAVRVKETFYLHRRRYGARRIAAHLKAEGHQAGRCRVRTLMRGLELQAIRPRRFVPRTTDSRHGVEPSPNLLLGDGNAPRRPRAVVVGDITYPPLQPGGWGYPASWQDKFTKRVVGWAVAERMTEWPVITALEKALAQGGVGRGAIIHSDQGSRYVSNNFGALLRAHGCRQSMPRRGNCYANARAESFLSRYKAELLEGGAFEDVSQARSETFGYVEGYYSRVRRHSALGCKTPEEFERGWEIETKGGSSERVSSGKT